MRPEPVERRASTISAHIPADSATLLARFSEALRDSGVADSPDQTIRLAPKHSMAHCLAEIHRGVAAFVADFDPRHVALEQTIYVQNFQTAQILGAARGAAITAASLQAKEIFEYAPLRVKQAVTGQGRASKVQLARTVMAMLGHGRILALDESDAAGVALCHAFTWRP